MSDLGSKKEIVIEPGLLQKATNLTETLVDVATSVMAGNKTIAQKSHIEQRMDICKACQFYLPAREVCGVCGCNMAFKTRLLAGKCIKGKW